MRYIKAVIVSIISIIYLTACGDATLDSNATGETGNIKDPISSPTSGVLMKDGEYVVNEDVYFYDNGGDAKGYHLTKTEDQFLVIKPSDKNKKVQLSFNSFNTYFNDLLYVYSGSGENKKLIGYYSDNYDKNIQDPNNALETIQITNMPTFTSTASDGSLTVRFDNNSHSEEYLGWKAVLKQVDKVKNLLLHEDTIYVDSNISFYDNGGENSNAVSNIKDDTNITFYPSDNSKFISISFDSFNMSSSDALYFYYVHKDKYTLFRKYSGNLDYTVADPNDATKTILKTKARSLTHYRRGDAIMVRYIKKGGASKGFKAHLSQSDKEGDVELFAGALTLESNVSTYKFYDDGGKSGNYYATKSKTMTIYPSDSTKKVSIDFTSASIYYGHKLYIYDGNTTENYIGYLTDPVVITSTAEDGSLTLKLVSANNSSYVESGWEATITQE